MDKSIWVEQIDTALIKYIQSIIRVEDTSLNLVPLSAYIRNPEKLFKPKTMPCALIYNYDMTLAKDPYSDDLLVSRNTPKEGEDFLTANFEKPALNANLFYQIDFFTKMQSDMNSISKTWIAHTGNYFSLPVIDKSGSNDVATVSLIDFVKRDSFVEDERIFRWIFSYKISAIIDESSIVVKKLVEQVEINKR